MTSLYKTKSKMEKKKCIGFVLIRQYPGCNKQIGYFEKYTTGEFLQYPEIWKPVYENENTILATKNYLIEVKVTKQ